MVVTPCQLDTYLPAFTLMLETEVAPRTVEGYTQSIENFARFAGGHGLPVDPAALTAEHIRSFLVHLATHGRSANTLRQYHAALRRFFAWLVREGDVTTSPMNQIPIPRPPDRLIDPFTTDELERLNAAARMQPNRTLTLRDYALLLVLEDTGARASEVTGLTLDRIDWRQRVFRLIGKGNRERLVAVSGKTMRAVAAYLKARRVLSGLVFVSLRGEPLNRNSLLQALRRIGLRAGVEGVRTHRFRHTYGDLFSEAGGQEGDLQTVFGHSTSDMTRRYTNARKTQRAIEAMRRFSPVEKLG